MSRRSPFAFAFIAVVALLATGCVRTETVPVLYRIPLEGNSHGSDAARACAAACRTANGSHENGFFACIGTCPDTQVMRDAACSSNASETPPQALCYTRLVERDVADPALANFLGGLIGVIAEAGVRAAIHGHHGHGRDRAKADRRSAPHAEKRVAARPRRRN